MSWINRLVGSLRKRPLENNLDDELQFHIEMRTREFIASGMTPKEARHRAQRLFGNQVLLKERTRDMDTIGWIETLGQDLRYGLRSLRKSPGFATVVILSLALGIGANTAIFTLIDAVLLKMLPVKNPQQLVLLRWAVPAGQHPMGSRWMDGSTWEEQGKGVGTSFSHPTYQEIRAHGTGKAGMFSGVLAFTGIGDLNALANGEASLASAQLVSANYFSVLSINPAIGRTFVESDDKLGSAPVGVISDRYWKGRFGGDRSIVGKAIVINGVPVTVVGVTPPEFFGLRPGSAINISLPLSIQPLILPRWDPKVSLFTAADHWWVLIMGRLKPGVLDRQLVAGLDTVFKQSATERFAADPEERAAIASLELVPASQGIDDLRRQFSRPLLILMGMVGMVLLIACANVASLLLARATARQREIGVRLSLGAARGRLIRQLLTESILLAWLIVAIGLALGIPASFAATHFAASTISDLLYGLKANDVTSVVIACAALVVVSGVAGYLPALRASRIDPIVALRDD
jgi:predicted permease